jgi:hypothetical protein
MPMHTIETKPEIRAIVSDDLVVALDQLLRSAGASLTTDQRLEVLSIIVAAGCALHRARSTCGIFPLR